jgi:hypothetical protein
MSSTYVKRHTVPATTTSAGAATVYTPAVTGRVLQIRYVKTDFADGVDVAVTLETTGLAVLTEANVNASVTFVPRQATHDVNGDGLTYDGTYTQTDFVYVANERVQIAVTSGGDTKTGTFYVWIG